MTWATGRWDQGDTPAWASRSCINAPLGDMGASRATLPDFVSRFSIGRTPFFAAVTSHSERRTLKETFPRMVASVCLVEI
jgi:hypothetical protein